MSKVIRTIYSGVALILALAIPLTFQNCGMSPEYAGQLDMASSMNVDQETEFLDIHPDTLEEEEKLIGTTFEPIIADRRYVLALFQDIFGPTTTNVDTWNLETNALEFGSACSIYSAYRDVNSKGALASVDASDSCSLVDSTSILGANALPKGTVTRQALVAKACTDLVMNNTTLGYALKRISTEAVPTPSSKNLRTMFHLFYRDKPAPDETLIQSLQVMFGSGTVNAASWRAPLYTVCASSYWQVL